MKILTSIVALSALATGTTGAAYAYMSTAPPPSTSTSSPGSAGGGVNGTAGVIDRVIAEPAVRLKVRYRKCAAGAHLEKGRCVRRVVRTVVLPAAPAVVPAATASSRSAGSGPAPVASKHLDVEDGHHATHEDRTSEPGDRADTHEHAGESESGDDHGLEQGQEPGEDHGDEPGHDD